MPSVQETLAELVQSYTNLFNKYNNKIDEIETEVTDAVNELDTNWTNKEAQIDSDVAAKLQEVDDRLADFDNLVFYAAPTTQGDGNGLTLGNAATLQTILDTKIVNSVVNKIYLTSGQHVLTNLTQLSKVYFLHMLPEGVYDSGNPPIIITQHTTDAHISTDTTGSPSPSQLCDAHDFDETPLDIIDSTVLFENISIRGTRSWMRNTRSLILSTGDFYADIWVHTIACTAHSCMGIEFVEGGKFYGDNDAMIFNVWHPDYIGCSANLQPYSSPLIIDNNSQFFQNGILEWHSNLPVIEYPKQLLIGFRDDDVETSKDTAINVLNNSICKIAKLKTYHVAQLFFCDESSQFDIGYWELITGSDEVKWVGQSRNSEVRLTADDTAWPDNASPNHVKIKNAGIDPEHATMLAYDGGKVVLRGIDVTGNCDCNTFLTVDGAVEVIGKDGKILAANRAGNIGFREIINNTASEVSLTGMICETRLGDSDTAFIVSRGGRTEQRDGTIITSDEYLVDSGGVYIDQNGDVFGGQVQVGGGKPLGQLGWASLVN